MAEWVSHVLVGAIPEDLDPTVRDARGQLRCACGWVSDVGDADTRAAGFVRHVRTSPPRAIDTAPQAVMSPALAAVLEMAR